MTDEYGMDRETPSRPCMRPPAKQERAGVRPKHLVVVANWVTALAGLGWMLWVGGWLGAAVLALAFVYVVGWLCLEHWATVSDRWPWERKQ